MCSSDLWPHGCLGRSRDLVAEMHPWLLYSRWSFELPNVSIICPLSNIYVVHNSVVHNPIASGREYRPHPMPVVCEFQHCHQKKKDTRITKAQFLPYSFAHCAWYTSELFRYATFKVDREDGQVRLGYCLGAYLDQSRVTRGRRRCNLGFRIWTGAGTCSCSQHRALAGGGALVDLFLSTPILPTVDRRWIVGLRTTVSVLG